jgi:hypothetical protein
MLKIEQLKSNLNDNNIDLHVATRILYMKKKGSVLKKEIK